MSIRVIRPGLLTTVQDLGRWGKQCYGVVVGGGMDSFALRTANFLVGNDENAATLELTLLGPSLRFEQNALIAFCGADFRPQIGEHNLLPCRPTFVHKGSVLNCGSASAGCRGYLAVAGGIDVPLVLGSRSTYLRCGMGGHEGRALKESDRLPIGPPSSAAAQLLKLLGHGRSSAPIKTCRWRIGSVAPAYTDNPTLRILLGSEFDWLSPRSREDLFSGEFEVTAQSDRMGYRLSGPPLMLTNPRELISEAVCPGTIQVPADGQPILLMADCATTGGYPKVAHVASVDLPLAAQLRPGGKLRLAAITLEEAQAIYREREEDLARLKVGIELKLRESPWDEASI